MNHANTKIYQGFFQSSTKLLEAKNCIFYTTDKNREQCRSCKMQRRNIGLRFFSTIELKYVLLILFSNDEKARLILNYSMYF